MTGRLKKLLLKEEEGVTIAAANENKETALDGSLRKDKCWKGDACSFRHDENKKGKGKGTNPTRSLLRLKPIF